jgi:hypothetical protein
MSNSDQIEQLGDIDCAEIVDRVGALDWNNVSPDPELDAHGCAVIGPIFNAKACAADPLPPLVAELRTAIYRPLAEIANRWNAAMHIDARYPPEHQPFLDRCREAGQVKPNPLLPRYGPDDYNCLHQHL